MGAAFSTHRRSSTSQPARQTSSTGPMNSAFVFVKPHANNEATQKLVKSTLEAKGVRVLSEGDIASEKIDSDKLIDQHYYAIASKATILKPTQLDVPNDKFKEKFGLDWKDAVDKAYNAMDACEYLGLDSAGLNSVWRKAETVKLGGGFYCAYIDSVEGKEPIYVFNAFFMSMRQKFTTPGLSIHYYVVEFSPSDLSWADFRGKVLGPTSPQDAPKDSIRGMILSQWEILGLASEPNTSDNGVHASASPFEGLAERMNWLGTKVEEDDFGKALMAAGVSAQTIKEWSVDPVVAYEDDSKGSIFDALEDLDVTDCLAKCGALNRKVSTAAPEADAPPANEPAANAPTSEGPSDDAPHADAAAADAPHADAPAADAPAADVLHADDLAADTSATEEPAADAPPANAPGAEKPDVPVADAPGATSSPTLSNSAFVFVKPHANNEATQKLVKSTLEAKGVRVLSEGDIASEKIDSDKLIDQHYYAIASKATILKPTQLDVPNDKFKEKFGLDWKDAVDKAYNAMDACEYLGLDSAGLNSVWRKAETVKLGGGFYCAYIDSVEGKEPIYVFNAFFMSMRQKFTTPGLSIHYYVVEFSPSDLSWADFRGKVLGPTSPQDAPKDSIRGMILSQWEILGLASEPNTSDNGVHASASPFEGLAERMNWLGTKVEEDDFGKALMAAGVSAQTIKEWSVDPVVAYEDDSKGSIFDALEDLDVADCLAKCEALDAASKK